VTDAALAHANRVAVRRDATRTRIHGAERAKPQTAREASQTQAGHDQRNTLAVDDAARSRPKFIRTQMFQERLRADTIRPFARLCPETNRTYLKHRRSSGRRAIRAGAAAPTWRMTMSFVNDLKKFAIARLKERRHRQTVMYLNSLPIELRKDIGWIDGKRRFE
jgi:hypothetical protein